MNKGNSLSLFLFYSAFLFRHEGSFSQDSDLADMMSCQHKVLVNLLLESNKIMYFFLRATKCSNLITDEDIVFLVCSDKFIIEVLL